MKEQQLREVQKKFKEAYRKNATQTESDTKYSVSDKNIKDVQAYKDFKNQLKFLYYLLLLFL